MYNVLGELVLLSGMKQSYLAFPSVKPTQESRLAGEFGAQIHSVLLTSWPGATAGCSLQPHPISPLSATRNMHLHPPYPVAPPPSLSSGRSPPPKTTPAGIFRSLSWGPSECGFQTFKGRNLSYNSLDRTKDTPDTKDG